MTRKRANRGVHSGPHHISHREPRVYGRPRPELEPVPMRGDWWPCPCGFWHHVTEAGCPDD